MMGFGRKTWFRYRVVIYALVVVCLLIYRNQINWSRLTTAFRSGGTGDQTLTLAGRDLAPGLVDVLVEHYRRDYPDLDIRAQGGGTNQALEDLVNRRVDVAFLSRLPTPAEQDLFRQVDGDTAIVETVGIGAILILAGSGALTADPPSGNDPTLTMVQLRGLMAGDMQGLGERFYVADPNLGHWEAAAKLVGRPSAPVDEAEVIFLADDRQVVRAVANDPQALGMIASFDLPASPAWPLPAGKDSLPSPRIVRLGDPSWDQQADPIYEKVATGVYPLFVPLYVACRTNGGIQGGKFLTHLASGRGQRQVERAGCIPAKQVLREIYLTTRPVGE